ncbi:MAG TPA: PAS domain S-box protein, partial [Syntrophomonadaceae bacterium]|nr:PAS domain S-box protein [Syntrophomonadaceae bacterium]
YIYFIRRERANLIGQTIFDTIPAKYIRETLYFLDNLTVDKPEANGEYMWTNDEGNIHWRRWTIRAIFDEDHVLMEYQGVGRDITESKAAEEEIKKRLTIENAIARASKLLVGSEGADVDEILKIIGSAIAVNRVYLFELAEDGSKLKPTHAWCCSTESKLERTQQRNIEPQDFPWGYSKLLQGENLVVEDRNVLPPQAAAEKKLLIQLDIYAALLVPIKGIDGVLLGFIGFDDTKSRRWKEEDIHCLIMLAELLGAYWNRKKMEQALWVSVEQFRTLAETAPSIIFVWDPNNDTSLLYLNTGYTLISGYTKREALQTHYWDFVHPDYRDMLRIRGQSRLHGHFVPDRYEVPFLSKNGEVIYGDMALTTIEWDGKPAVMGVICDITERKQMEQELRLTYDELENRVRERTSELVSVNEKLRLEIKERQQIEQELQHSEANFRKLAETSPAMIPVYKEDGFLYVNSTFEKMIGYSREELLKMSPWDPIHPDYREMAKKNYFDRQNGVKIPPYELIIQNKNGQEIWGYLYADIIDYEGQSATLGMIVDITERKKLEEDLLQASKLESLGILAGGIAHDFNNILTVISGNVSLAKMIIDVDNEVTEILTEVEQAALQARDLTQQLLTFSKGGAPIKETASIKDLLQETTSFVLRGSNVSCSFYIADDLWPVSIDKGQISQVINNLIINADQSMPEGGIIRLMAVNISSDAELPASLNPGNYIKITIKDKGIGIVKKHLDKIFDPYFTTKQKGHGLGLATCYSIIKKHDGDIDITSKIGIGTTVNVYLPAYPDQIVESKNSPRFDLHGQGKILIMDDEAIVRDTLGKMLQHLGYTVNTAEDGIQAIHLYQKARQINKPYDLVLMDLTIAGGMGGKEAVKKLLEIDPYARVIVSSGYSNDPVMSDYKKYGFCGVLPKPYEIQAVSKVLYELLDRQEQDMSQSI